MVPKTKDKKETKKYLHHAPVPDDGDFNMNSSSVKSCSSSMEPMTVRCDVTACWTSVGSGEQTFSPLPDSVSRTTLLKTLVVAAFGTPGRTTTVGSRAERPTTSVIVFFVVWLW